MEMQLSKRIRVGNGGGGGASEAPMQQLGRQMEDDGEGDGKPSLRSWHNHASRICRVSRASGGKDRHSKVLTAKGLRDRRVRLSVSTAIQFYDLQDRLGYDQPSKAVEWLIKAASAAIADLPSLDAAFPDLQSQLMGFKHSAGADSGPGRRDEDEDAEKDDDDRALQQQHQHLSLDKSACSSTSETSKGSVLSLSRSETRGKAREETRAKERATARKKDKCEQDGNAHISDTSFHHNINHDHHNSHASFTDLLTGGVSVNHNLVTVAHHANSTAAAGTTAGYMHKQILHFSPTSTTDYFGQASPLGQLHKSHHSSGYASQTHFPHNSSVAVVPFNVTAAVAAAANADHSEIQPQLPFVQDQIIPIAAVAPGGDYNLNFSISSGLNRGTLQSNSSSSFTHLHHHLQRLPSAVDGSNLPFFFGVAGPTTHATSVSAGDNHFPTGFDGRLQFCYLDLKGKDKN